MHKKVMHVSNVYACVLKHEWSYSKSWLDLVMSITHAWERVQNHEPYDVWLYIREEKEIKLNLELKY